MKRNLFFTQGMFGGGGNPMSEAMQQQLANQFGHDLSGVSAYEGGGPTDVGGGAFTDGQDIYMSQSQYSPHASGEYGLQGNYGTTHTDPMAGKGKSLLGHELSHITQQGN